MKMLLFFIVCMLLICLIHTKISPSAKEQCTSNQEPESNQEPDLEHKQSMEYIVFYKNEYSVSDQSLVERYQNLKFRYVNYFVDTKPANELQSNPITKTDQGWNPCTKQYTGIICLPPDERIQVRRLRLEHNSDRLVFEFRYDPNEFTESEILDRIIDTERTSKISKKHPSFAFTQKISGGSVLNYLQQSVHTLLREWREHGTG